MLDSTLKLERAILHSLAPALDKKIHETVLSFMPSDTDAVTLTQAQQCLQTYTSEDVFKFASDSCQRAVGSVIDILENLSQAPPPDDLAASNNAFYMKLSNTITHFVAEQVPSFDGGGEDRVLTTRQHMSCVRIGRLASPQRVTAVRLAFYMLLRGGIEAWRVV